MGFWALSCILQNSLPCCRLDFSLRFILPLSKLQPERLMLNKPPCSETFCFNFPLSDLPVERFQGRLHQSRFPLLWFFSTELGRRFLGCQTFPGQSRSHPPLPREQQGPKGTSIPNLTGHCQGKQDLRLLLSTGVHHPSISQFKPSLAKPRFDKSQN